MKALYFIADYHALTTVHDPAALRQNILDVALDLPGLGLDPAKATFSANPMCPRSRNLAWILSTITLMGLLERCHSYKDKLARGWRPRTAFLPYPVLMAADILIYQSQQVPVGKDQKQHIEVTRDLALRFNNQYGRYLPSRGIDPPPVRCDPRHRRPEDEQVLREHPGDVCRGEGLRKRVMGIVTDSTPVEAPKQPETVYALYSLFANEAEREEMLRRYQAGGMGYAVAKTALYEKIVDYFRPYRRSGCNWPRIGPMWNRSCARGRNARGIGPEDIDQGQAGVGVEGSRSEYHLLLPCLTSLFFTFVSTILFSFS